MKSSWIKSNKFPITLFVSKIFNRIKAYLCYPIVRMFTFSKSLCPNKYFCISMIGDNYGCNVKALADFIKKKEPDSIVVWGFTDNFYNSITCDYTKTRLYSLKFYYHLLTSKYVISNATMNSRILHKRKGQIYLQTWHGTALKKIGIDAKTISRFSSNNLAFDSSKIDFFISGSTFMSNVYRDKLLFTKKIYLTGTPRNDIFFKKNNEKLRAKVFAYLSIEQTCKILLYAPTFRDDMSFKYYDVNLNLIKKRLEEEEQCRYVIAIRLHPLMISLRNELKNKFQDFIDATLYPDMQELLACSDCLVTDYSSSMFDFMYTRKPVIIYAKDASTYERGFYFNLKELPFIIVNNNEDLAIQMHSFSIATYESKIKAFEKFIGSVEDGCATERVYNLIKYENK